MTDYDPLINPPPEPSPALIRLTDGLSWLVQVVAAVLSIGCGIAAYLKAEDWAAGLGIAAGVAGLSSVAVAYYAGQIRERLRDQRMAKTESLAALSLEISEMTDRDNPNFN